nr:DUF1194 domain-containing protein [Puniceibacterium sp. IMCC21224]
MLCLWAAPLAAQDAESDPDGCRLALLLALDVSSSVDSDEHRLQQTGVAAALGDADIRRALLSGPPVALAVYEWSGRRNSVLVLDWLVLDGPPAIDRAIAAILSAPRSETRYPTAMGFALGYGATVMRRAPSCARRVIDLSGDGISNDGFGPELAYRHFPFTGITVNGLAVLGDDPQVLEYFEDVVRFGDGAFVETTQGYAGYRRAMTRKLFREISDMIIGERATSAEKAPG